MRQVDSNTLTRLITLPMYTPHSHLFSKGVHVLVQKLTKVDKVLAFFASDGRLFFLIPMGNRTSLLRETVSF